MTKETLTLIYTDINGDEHRASFEASPMTMDTIMEFIVSGLCVAGFARENVLDAMSGIAEEAE